MSTSDEALNRYVTAKGYKEAAKHVFVSPHLDTEERRTSVILPLNMLTGFALELYFKSWLLAAGRPSDKVRGFGHKVGSLFNEVLSEGMPAISQLDEVVNALASGHEDFTFRYLESGDQINLINWEPAFQALDQLDAAVDAKIGASAAKGLSPGH